MQLTLRTRNDNSSKVTSNGNYWNSLTNNVLNLIGLNRNYRKKSYAEYRYHYVYFFFVVSTRIKYLYETFVLKSCFYLHRIKIFFYYICILCFFFFVNFIKVLCCFCPVVKITFVKIVFCVIIILFDFAPILLFINRSMHKIKNYV